MSSRRSHQGTADCIATIANKQEIDDEPAIPARGIDEQHAINLALPTSGLLTSMCFPRTFWLIRTKIGKYTVDIRTVTVIQQPHPPRQDFFAAHRQIFLAKHMSDWHRPLAPQGEKGDG